MTALGKIEARASWTDLRNVFEKALAAETAFDDGIYAEAIRRKREDGTAVDDRLADLSDMLTDVRVDAEEAMALMPAPDLAAAVFKIEYARKRWRNCDDWPDEWWAAVLSDLRRFAGAEKGVIQLPPLEEVTGRAEWIQAEGWYRALVDVEIEGMPEEVRSAIDHALCLTMNHLVEAAPAPDVDALILKMEIARDCSDAGMPSQWWDVLEADVERLVGRAPPAEHQLDRLIAGYLAAGDALIAGAAKADGFADDDPVAKAYLAATQALDAYQPVTPDEFVRSLAARFNDDAPPADAMVADIIATARRLAGEVVA